MLSTLAGAAILGADLPQGLLDELRGLLEKFSILEARRLGGRLMPLLWSYLLGSTLGALVISAVAYQTALVFIKAHRRRLDRSHREDPPVSGV